MDMSLLNMAFASGNTLLIVLVLLMVLVHFVVTLVKGKAPATPADPSKPAPAGPVSTGHPILDAARNILAGVTPDKALAVLADLQHLLATPSLQPPAVTPPK